MAPKAKGKGQPPVVESLVTVPDEPSEEVDLGPLTAALREESLSQTASILQSIEGLALSDQVSEAFIRENVAQILIDAISRCEDENTEALGHLYRCAACLAAWKGPVLLGLSKPQDLRNIPIRIIREWSKASKEPVIAAQEEVGDTKAAAKGGKKPTTPAPEEPKVPGPPVQVLIDCVTWLNASVDAFQDAAAASSEIAADHFINLLKHPSALVVDASLALFKSMLRLEVLLHALVTDGIVAHLCHLLFEASGTLLQQACILQLLTSLTKGPKSTACMDLHDESAVPRLVIMLAQPGGGIDRKPEGEVPGYVNSVPDGEAPPDPSPEALQVQQDAAALLLITCKLNPQCLDQAVSCGLGDVLLALLPSVDTIPELQVDIDSIPDVSCSTLSQIPPLCNPDDAATTSTGSSSNPRTPLSPNSTAFSCTSRRSRRQDFATTTSTTLAEPAAVAATAAAGSATAGGATRRRSSVAPGRTGRHTSAATTSGALAQEAAEVAAAAAAAAAANAGLPARPRLQTREWRALLRAPSKPTLSEEVVVFCVQLLGIVLRDEQLTAWTEQRLWTNPASHSWTDRLCMLCFPTLSVTPESHIDPPPEDPAPVAAKGKGKAAAPPTTPLPPAPKPLIPQFADSIRAAALHALDSALSDVVLERMVQQKLLMHVVEACITEQPASTSAAAVLLKRIVVMLVAYDKKRVAYEAAVAEAHTYMQQITPETTNGCSHQNGSKPASPHSVISDAAESVPSVARRKNTSRRNRSGGFKCPIAIPTIGPPLPHPRRALAAISRAARFALGLNPDSEPPLRGPFAPEATLTDNIESPTTAAIDGVDGAGVSDDVNAAGNGDANSAVSSYPQGARAAAPGSESPSTKTGKSGQAGSTAPVATAADPKPTGDSGEAEPMEGDSAENDLISAIKLEPFPEQYRAAIAAAAMAVPMDAYTPTPRPPLPQPPATPPPDPLPLNGYLWAAYGRTAMIPDGFDLSVNKIEELKAKKAAREAEAARLQQEQEEREQAEQQGDAVEAQ